MLEWATFGAAALAALGTFLGPIIAYRSVTRTAAATRRQADVDRYISFALEPDAVTCRLGVAQLQYLAPTLQFVLGVVYFGEQMSTGRWVGFGLVWLALMLMSGHGLHRANANRRERLVAEPV